METEKGRAVLAVSFGTSHADTCEKTIGAIEEEIRRAYPQYPVYRAWTSGMIRRKLEKRDGIHIFSVSEAMEQMKCDGISEVLVQPTHVLNGIENTRMEQEIETAGQLFDRIVVSSPLLTTGEDMEQVVQALTEEWRLDEDEMLVYMGHGTDHHSNAVYGALNDLLVGRGFRNMIIGTVEASPSVGDIVDAVKKTDMRRIVLAPFMIVAGDHANNDLAGDEEDSWKSIFEKEGYEVRCELKGLGEYESIRRIFLRHLNEALQELEKGQKQS